MPTIKTVSEVSNIVSMYVNNSLMKFTNSMPSGHYLDGHNNSIEKCDAIILLMDGSVCPVYRNHSCCLNPLRYRSSDTPYLSTFSISTPYFYFHQEIDRCIHEYNEECIQYKNFGACIIGYCEF